MHGFMRISLGMVVLIACCSAVAKQTDQNAQVAPSREILLSGNDWQLASFPIGQGEKEGAFSASFAESAFREVTVPAEVQRELGLKGMDEYYQAPKLSTVNEKEWWYRKRFEVPRDAEGKLVRLEFEGVDYFASVWLNGQKLGEHEGAFVPFSFDISRQIKYGAENLLVVRVTCPWIPKDRGFMTYLKGDRVHTPPRFNFPYPPKTLGPYTDDPPAYGNALLPMGLFRDVKLVISGWATVENVFVHTEKLNVDGSAELRITGAVIDHGSGNFPVKLGLEISPENFAGAKQTLPGETLTLHAGENSFARSVVVKNAKLWWTWDSGKQNLYKLRTTLSSSARSTDSWEVSFGIRTLERKPDMSYWLNGKRLFIKGAWYPTSDLFSSKPTAAQYESDLRLLRAGNMNHLVNFTIIEKPAFYEWSDRLGILLFVEFPFAPMGPELDLTHTSSGAKAFMEKGLTEVGEIITLLRNHPSVIEWASLAEAHGKEGGGWGLGNIPYDSVLYDQLSAAAARKVSELDPGTIYQESFCDFGEHHFWMANAGMGTTGNYTDQFDAKTKFVSEYGSLSLPPYQSLQRLLSPEDLWSEQNRKLPNWFHLPINISAYAYITSFEYDGLYSLLSRVNQFVDRNVKSAEQLADDSMLYQAFLLSYAAQAYRRKMHDPINGIRFWGYRDIWPGIHWYIIDYDGIPTMGFYYMKQAQERFALTFAYKDALESQVAGSTVKIPVWMVNEYHRPVAMEATCEIVNLKGEKIWSREFRGNVGQDQSQSIGEVEWQAPDEPGVYVLKGVAQETGGALHSESTTYIKVTPKLFRRQVRVLVIGEKKYNTPIVQMLQGAGLRAEEIDEEDFHQLARLKDTEELRKNYDVVWLASFDSLWKLLSDDEAKGLREAIKEGVGFIHTGGMGSFHGGAGMGACLEFTPLGEVLPVKLQSRNDVFTAPKTEDASFGVKAGGAGERAITDIQATGNAGTEWNSNLLRQVGLTGFNRVEVAPGSDEVMSISSQPLVVLGRYGQGRTVAFTGFTPTYEGEHDFWNPEPVIPYLLDQKLYDDPQTPAYFDVFMRMIAAATGEQPATAYAEVVAAHEKPLFEMLKDQPPAELGFPQVVEAMRSGSTAHAKLKLVNGGHYARLVRLREQWNQTEGAPYLVLYNQNYFDLLPNETKTVDVEFFMPKGFQGSLTGKLVVSGTNVSEREIPIAIQAGQ